MTVFPPYHHNHKKRKDRLEAWVERNVQHAYFENQAILGPILPYRASKYKQTKKSVRLLRLFVNLNFTFLCDIISVFPFFFQDANDLSWHIKLCPKRFQHFNETI